MTNFARHIWHHYSDTLEIVETTSLENVSTKYLKTLYDNKLIWEEKQEAKLV